MSDTLPLPDDIDARRSAELRRKICEEAREKGGRLGFDRYMELALYAPGLGYYTGPSQKFGAGGDFITAPEITPLFTRALAAQVAQGLKLTGGVVLEFGAGSGLLATEMLSELERRGSLPAEYLILEVSGELKARQADALQLRVPHLMDRVRWLDALPSDEIDGVVVANEVLDAFPVERFRVAEGRVESQVIQFENDSLELAWSEAHPALAKSVKNIVAECGLSTGFESEYCSRLGPWMKALSDSLGQALVLLLDYGYSRRDYYHTSRAEGTVVCHYRHRAHNDALFQPGLQDITAHVDFTAVGDAALDAGLQVAGYTTQAQFLLGCGIGELLAEVQETGGVEAVKAATAVKRLLLPTEMGERFKVMALTRGIQQSPMGFVSGDLRHRL